MSAEETVEKYDLEANMFKVYSGRRRGGGDTMVWYSVAQCVDVCCSSKYGGVESVAIHSELHSQEKRRKVVVSVS
jgi:hypothetical protein